MNLFGINCSSQGNELNQYEKPMHTSSIMIVDDHPLVRDGIRQLIDSESDLNLCCEAATISEAMRLMMNHSPDLVIIDLSLPDGNGLDLVKRMHKQHPKLPILVYSMHDTDLFADRALGAGAKGYINKQEAGEQLLVAARQVLNGKIYLSPQTIRDDGTKIPASSPFKSLSNRELGVFELIGHGMSTSDIADKLNLSVKTIESHRANIKSKLKLNSAGELIRCAVQWTLDT